MYGEFYPTGYYGATPQMQDRLVQYGYGHWNRNGNPLI